MKTTTGGLATAMTANEPATVKNCASRMFRMKGSCVVLLCKGVVVRGGEGKGGKEV